MKCEVAIHDFFTTEEEELEGDAEFSNLWVKDVELPIEEMKEWNEREITTFILDTIMMMGNWVLPHKGCYLNGYYDEEKHTIINDAFGKSPYSIIRNLYCFDSFRERLEHNIISDGWHIVREKSEGSYEWLGQGSSFDEEKLIND
jgi:hypothetical protein